MSGKRAVVFIAIGYLALILTASMQVLSPWHLPTPEVMLLVVLYLGLSGRGSVVAHVGLALVLGYLADLFAGSPNGLHALSLSVCMLLARAASARLLVTTQWHTVGVAALAALLHSLLLLLLSSTMYGNQVVNALGIVPATVCATALLAPLGFAALRKLDRRLAYRPRALRIA
jgi:rod shape-determining protein MreD